MIRLLAWVDRHAGLLVVAALLLAAALFLASCTSDRPAEDTKPAAITTSAQAQDLIHAKEYELAVLKVQMSELRRTEISNRLTLYAWIMIAAGALASIGGAVLWLRLPGPLAGWIAGGGAAVLSLGLLGLWLAPWWLQIAWAAGGLLLLAVIAGLIYAIHDHQAGLRSLWDKTQDEARSDPRLAKLLRKARIG